MGENIKVCVLGCGKMGERHITAYKKLDADVVVYDLNKELARGVAERYGIEFTENYKAMISFGKIDAIDVCTPTPTHKKIILDAIDRGIKYIFCEKPLAGTLKDVKDIKEAVDKKGVLLTTGYLYRFFPAFSFIKEILENKIIGDPYFSIFRLGGRGSHREWKHRRVSYGGAILDMMVHMIDLILWYFGDIVKAEKLYEDVLLKEREIGDKIVKCDAEDIVLVKFITKNDVIVICESDLVTPSYSNYVEIQGTNGTIFCSIQTHFPTIVYCKKQISIYNQGFNFYNFPQENIFLKELGYFIECIKEGKKNVINNVDDSIKILEIVEELRRQ